MTEHLKEATQAWLSLLDQRADAAALDLFCGRIVPLLLDRLHERFRADYPERTHGGRYDGLISLLGYTPDTVILAARFTAPRSMVVLHTPETTPFLDAVRVHSGLSDAALREVVFDKASTNDLRRAFEEALASFAHPSEVALELTGGTKPMGAVLHLAAAERDVDTLYIDYAQYDPRHRKPMPESTFIRLIERAPQTRPRTFRRDVPSRDLDRALRSIRASVGTALMQLERRRLPLDAVRPLLQGIAAEIDQVTLDGDAGANEESA